MRKKKNIESSLNATDFLSAVFRYCQDALLAKCKYAAQAERKLKSQFCVRCGVKGKPKSVHYFIFTCLLYAARSRPTLLTKTQMLTGRNRLYTFGLQKIIIFGRPHLLREICFRATLSAGRARTKTCISSIHAAGTLICSPHLWKLNWNMKHIINQLNFLYYCFYKVGMLFFVLLKSLNESWKCENLSK